MPPGVPQELVGRLLHLCVDASDVRGRFIVGVVEGGVKGSGLVEGHVQKVVAETEIERERARDEADQNKLGN